MNSPERVRDQLDRYTASSEKSADKLSHIKPKEANTMTEAVSRYELDAKLETIEARMDARIGRIEESNTLILAGISSMKTTSIVTAISAVLAIAAVNVGIMQGMFGAFESGKSTATAIAQTAEQQRQIAEQLRQTAEQQNKTAEQLKQTQDDIKTIRERLDQQTR